MSELVSELLHFFEMREGQHISSVDVEEVMEKAAVRIEQLEALESAAREMLSAGEWRKVYPCLRSIGYETMPDVEEDEALIQAVRDRLGEDE